ncbi:MAG TPA: PilZ domain-containing protein [bacterium]
MEAKSGWMEKRKHERVVATLKVSFQMINPEVTKKLLKQENYRTTTAEHLPELSKKSQLYEAVTRDLSICGLAMHSQHPLPKGSVAEVHMDLPNFSVTLKFLAEVRHVEKTMEMGRAIYSAGMRIMAINKEDVKRIEDYLVLQKQEQG